MPSASIVWPKCRPGGSVLIRRLVYVAFFLEVGLLLIVLPWSAFWEENYFAVVWPALGDLLSNNYARGAISGLGVVNVVAGIADLTPLFTGRDRGRAGSVADVPDVRDLP